MRAKLRLEKEKAALEAAQGKRSIAQARRPPFTHPLSHAQPCALGTFHVLLLMQAPSLCRTPAEALRKEEAKEKRRKEREQVLNEQKAKSAQKKVEEVCCSLTFSRLILILEISIMTCPRWYGASRIIAIRPPLTLPSPRRKHPVPQQAEEGHGDARQAPRSASAPARQQ